MRSRENFLKYYGFEDSPEEAQEEEFYAQYMEWVDEIRSEDEDASIMDYEDWEQYQLAQRFSSMDEEELREIQA
jgi:hypothetical protein